MKKSIFLTALAVVAAVSTGCDKERQTRTILRNYGLR